MFDGPWGGFLALIVFFILTVKFMKFFDGPSQEEREEEQKKTKRQLEWDKTLAEENKKQIISEYKRDQKMKRKKKKS